MVGNTKNENTMTTLIHCYKHDRGYFDFVSSTLRLAELYPQHEVTWAVPSTRILSSVLSTPQTELYRDRLDCTFHSFYARGCMENRRGFEEFSAKLEQIKKPYVYCDFRHGCNNEISEKYRVMLEFKPDIALKTLEEIRSRFGDKYSVLHVRTGDDELCHGKKIVLDRWVDAIQDYLAGVTLSTVLVCDCVSLKERMAGQLLCTSGTPYHSSNKGGNIAAFVFDVLTIQNAQSIHSMMSNPWGGSAFSRIPAAFAKIPYTHRNLPVKLS